MEIWKDEVGVIHRIEKNSSGKYVLVNDFTNHVIIERWSLSALIGWLECNGYTKQNI